MIRNSHDRAYMTPNEVAELLMVSPVTIRQWAQKELLKATTTPGGHRRFLREEVERFARERGIKIDPESPLRVLVVDDNRTFARYLVDLLSSQVEPIETESAYDGFDAGRKVLQFRPDLVLLDLRMPGMDGFAVCQQLKEDEATRHIRIIAMTGYNTPETEAKILGVGADACISKPFDKDILFGYIGLVPTADKRDNLAVGGLDQHVM